MRNGGHAIRNPDMLVEVLTSVFQAKLGAIMATALTNLVSIMIVTSVASSRLNSAAADVQFTDVNAATIIPDWVDPYSSPHVSVNVVFGSESVSNGKKFLQNSTQQSPSVAITNVHPQEGALYTLLMVDPDAVSPTAPIYRNVLHWLVANIPIGSTDVSKEGTEVVAYAGPQPPMGVHRYYVLVFKQKEKLNLDAISERRLFDVRSFTEEHGLSYPVGGAFFTVEAGA